VELTAPHYAVIFLFGLLFGSFFNVAIHRWPKEDPKEREWVKTPSHCPKCGSPIKWYDNIPIVSWLLLGAKCRNCKAPISWRYPLVELGTALLWLLTAWLTATRGFTGVPLSEINAWHLVFAIVLASLYLLTVIIDLETQLIPDEITVPHFLVAWAMVFICFESSISSSWHSSLIGMFALSACFAVFSLLNAMGWGDVLFALGMGVIFGWPLVMAVGLLGIFMGGIVGLIIILVLIARKRYKMGLPMPFGPFLAIASYICLFWGIDIVNWYLKLVGFAPMSSGLTVLP
jgi:leader peptidase (prepilin peptidase)/N-methyltransferase